MKKQIIYKAFFNAGTRDVKIKNVKATNIKVAKKKAQQIKRKMNYKGKTVVIPCKLKSIKILY